MTDIVQADREAAAADEIGRLAKRMLALAPVARLHVGIKIEPARSHRGEQG